jgi:two-component system, LytTR family, response regulator
MRVAIVDDERLARDRLRRLVASTAGTELVFQCGDADTAVTLTVQHRPDVLFLDIRMPGGNGFDVVTRLTERLDEGELPLVVFVTAWDDQAVRAFEAEAVDYLVKPFDDERFAEAMRRVRRRVGHRRVHSSAAAEQPGRLDRIVVKQRGRGRLVSATTVDWIEAEGVHARLHIAGESYLIRIAMHELEVRLDPRHFVRIHRSTIVNLDRVQDLYAAENMLVLQDGTSLVISRSRKAQLARLLGQSL